MRSLSCLTLLLLLVETAGALDLTPQNAFRVGNEGPPTPVIQLNNGLKKITFRPPAGWKVDGSVNTLNLSASDGSQAWMKVLRVANEPISNNAQSNVSPSPEEMQAWAARFIPEGAKDVTFVSTAPSPYTLGSLPSTEFIFSFVRYGSRDMISISIVNFSEKERLVVLISSSAKDFERIHGLGIACMFSWEETTATPKPSEQTGTAVPTTVPSVN